MDTTISAEMRALVTGRHANPHQLLGPSIELRPVSSGGDRVVIRGWYHGAVAMSIVVGRAAVPMRHLDAAGLFEGEFTGSVVPAYQLRIGLGDYELTVDDPYRFSPTVGDLDLHLLGEGRHEQLWRCLGAHVRRHGGVFGTSFAVWAPNARSVRVVGDFNRWDGLCHPMRALGQSGVWELFVPGLGPGEKYKYEILAADGLANMKSDPFAFETEAPPATASVIHGSAYTWTDEDWRDSQRERDQLRSPLSIYECHLGSWRRQNNEKGISRSLTYLELADKLPRYIADMGFTHVEFLPVSEYPFGPSWGYQVTGYYAPSARHGSPDEFRHLVNELHRHGIGVLIDWVPGHFPTDWWALAEFDGTTLYEYADPSQATHPDWGTLIFNYGRNEVRNFLIANALFWIDEYHIDGLRVDAVASMLDLSPGERITFHGSQRVSREALTFIKDLNDTVRRLHPQAITVAEDWTNRSHVSHPTSEGGMGFSFRWNMGWSFDTLSYFARDPAHRRWHHKELTFPLWYGFSENFVLPLSHDDVVYGKGSLLARMPGDRSQKYANLRSLLAWMWAHPGRKLLFMGAELAQTGEWNYDSQLEWERLVENDSAGVHELVRVLNRLYRSLPALWEHDSDWQSFRWIDIADEEPSILSFLRSAGGASTPVACVANLAPVTCDAYRLGLPGPANWFEVLNTDDVRFGGCGRLNHQVTLEDVPADGYQLSASITLPPLAILWFCRRQAV